MLADYDKIFFLDIETVPQYYNFNELSEKAKKLFSTKNSYALTNSDKDIESIYNEKGGILSEFNKIVCISVSVISKSDDNLSIHTTSYFNIDECTLLKEFCKMLNANTKQFSHVCAHNGKEFDFPVICRRLLVNNIDIPKILDNRHKKPWENNYLDTLDLWKFGDYKHYTSLDLLAHVFGIESPKDDINGADVAKVFYVDNDLIRIKDYCEKDSITLAKVYMRMAHNQIL